MRLDNHFQLAAERICERVLVLPSSRGIVIFAMRTEVDLSYMAGNLLRAGVDLHKQGRYIAKIFR